MRDTRFVAEHRGGALTKNQHRRLVLWACHCAENVLPLIEKEDQRLANAIEVAKEWTKDKNSVGDARNASVAAIEVANELTNPVDVAVARSVGHAVATAHMADHSLRAADYALKAIKLVEKTIQIEQRFQDSLLPPEIRELVLSARCKQNTKFNETKTAETTNR